MKKTRNKFSSLLLGAAVAGLTVGTASLASCSKGSAAAERNGCGGKKDANGCGGKNGCGAAHDKKDANGCGGHNGCGGKKETPKKGG
jgi:hypothetical protein